MVELSSQTFLCRSLRQTSVLLDRHEPEMVGFVSAYIDNFPVIKGLGRAAGRPRSFRPGEEALPDSQRRTHSHRHDAVGCNSGHGCPPPPWPWS